MAAALLAPTGAESLKSGIERLEALDIEALRVEWRRLFRKRVPKALPKSLLVKALTYQLQALAFGDLDPQALRVLDAYAAKSAGRWRGRVRVDRLGGAPPLSSGPRIKPGSILVREWAGELHRVMVLEAGFAWNGDTYRSLSKVALAITGTRWNGPRFFGLDRESEAANDGTTRGRPSLGSKRGLDLGRLWRDSGARRIVSVSRRPRHEPSVPLETSNLRRWRRKVARVALRHLHPRLHRTGARARLQLARRPA
jgi:hypothetical protein